MIKSDFGVISIKGNTPLIMAEFSSLIHSLIEKSIFTKEEIEELVKDGMKTKEQLQKGFSERHKDGIYTAEMQKYARAVVEARKSGLVKENDNSTEPTIRTILNNDDLKITEVRLNSTGKSKDEMAKELNDAIKEIFNEEDFNE